jgi:hypothetical protein
MTDKTQRAAQLKRIRDLLAKTVENGCTEAEAKAAAAAVDRLLALYEIDLDEVAVREMDLVQITVPGGTHAVCTAALNIARFCDCKAWTTNKRTSIVYYGFQVDTEIAEYLTMLFMRAIDSEVSNFSAFNMEYNSLGKSGRNEMLHSFRQGMATRLGDRLKDLKSRRDFTQRGTGTDLVAIKMPLVEQGFNELGIHLGGAVRTRGARNADAYNAGKTAADGVAINQGIAGYAEKRGMIR